jgi:DNA polymerase-4
MDRWILHVDMDEFFAAIERLDDPSLGGKCLLVGGDPQGRGVVSTASYEARQYGCRSAMPMSTALRRCPHAVVLPVRGRRYREVSEQVFAIFEQFTPVIEPLSIDEAFLDLTGSGLLFGPADQTAATIKQTIRKRLGLIASVGVAPNKFLAKLASDMDKPDGLTVIRPGQVHEMLDPLPIGRLWGIGPSVGQRLRGLGIRTIGELRRQDVRTLQAVLGNTAQHFLDLANGRDDRPVQPDHETKSIGQEQTFAEDIADPIELRRVLLQQVQQVARRLRKSRLEARTVTVKLRDGEFNTMTRSMTLEQATDLTDTLWGASKHLFENWRLSQSRPLRLIGMTASSLQPTGGGQMDLFSHGQSQRKKKLDRVLDDIADRFGPDAIGRNG